MKVEYPVSIGGKTVVISNELENDTEVFKFIHHMEELFGDTVCERNGQSSDKVKINVRVDSDENFYYEMVCYDRGVQECNYAKRTFGVNKKGGTLFPKNKDSNGNWRPWRKYNPETKTEE